VNSIFYRIEWWRQADSISSGIYSVSISYATNELQISSRINESQANGAKLNEISIHPISLTGAEHRKVSK